MTTREVREWLEEVYFLEVIRDSRALAIVNVLLEHAPGTLKKMIEFPLERLSVNQEFMSILATLERMLQSERDKHSSMRQLQQDEQTNPNLKTDG